MTLLPTNENARVSPGVRGDETNLFLRGGRSQPPGSTVRARAALRWPLTP